MSAVGVILTLIVVGHPGLGFLLALAAIPLWLVALLPNSAVKLFRRREAEPVTPPPTERELQIEKMLIEQMLIDQHRQRLERLAGLKAT